MRVLHLTTGVSRQSAVYRLNLALRKKGTDSKIYTGLRGPQEEYILGPKGEIALKLKAKFERSLLSLYPKRTSDPWNVGFLGNLAYREIEGFRPDVIHLHWVNQLLSIREICAFGRPVVWTMHDSWAFTGGCHIPGECVKYRVRCEKCPQLNGHSVSDLSTKIFDHKTKRWAGSDINVIGPSKWMCEAVRSSSIFSTNRVENIANCIDTGFFSPKDKLEARRRFGIAEGKKVILFGANNAKSDRNKGYDLLLAALKEIHRSRNDVELVVFGAKEVGWDQSLKVRSLGVITEPVDFPQLYSAADVVVNASRSENFSNVILESLACGTPVIAFDIGGNSDLIADPSCGNLAKPYDTDDLAIKILAALEKTWKSHEVRMHVVERFGELSVANSHLAFYQEVIENWRSVRGDRTIFGC